MPDRRYAGSWADLPEADCVIVASRRKPDWLPGTTLCSADGCFTVGRSFDHQMPDGLRTVYPLTRPRESDVVRHGVHYELPPLRSGAAPHARSRQLPAEG